MKYIIHACESRMWYVRKFLIPQLQQQGIKDITIWLDDNNVGNLESCMQCFENLPDDDENVWHLQDDVQICSDFKKKTEKFKNYDGIVCGTTVLKNEVEYEMGETDLANLWYSFPCIMIPNKLANECSSWYKKQFHNPIFYKWKMENRGDDYVFRCFLEEMHPDVKVYNVVPNLANHIDDLINGSTFARRLPGKYRASFWNEDDLTDKLAADIMEYKTSIQRVALYTGTRNLYPGMIASAMSLVKNSSVEKIYLLIEDDSIENYIDEEVPDYIEVMNISKIYEKYFPKDSPNMKSRFSYMALMRSTVAKLFPQYDRMLVLDCDIIINENIDELWEYCDDNHYLAAALEPDCSKDGKYEKMENYYNIGVCLYNLKKIREDKIADQVIKELNTKEYAFVEQDVFNIVCEGKFIELPGTYNGCHYCKPCDKPKITHFAGKSDWQGEPLVQQYMSLNFKDLRNENGN